MSIWEQYRRLASIRRAPLPSTKSESGQPTRTSCRNRARANSYRVQKRASEIPEYVTLGIGLIGAERGGANSLIKIAREAGIMILDATDRDPDRARDVDASAFCAGRSAPVTATESDSARQLSRQRLDFLIQLEPALLIACPLGLFEFVGEILDALAVRRLRLHVENLAGIA